MSCTAKIDITVINSIVNSYRRAAEEQKNIYGLILGTKNEHEYDVVDCLIGFLIEDKNEKSGFAKISEKFLNTLLSSYNQNFVNFPKKQGIKSVHVSMKEKPSEFQKLNNMMIIGGFATGKELFNEIGFLLNSINTISNKVFENKSSLLLLVDPILKEDKETHNLKYNIRTFTYKWDKVFFKNKNEISMMKFKEIDNEIYNNLTNVKVINQIGTEDFRLMHNIEAFGIKKENADTTYFSKGKFEITDFIKNLEETDTRADTEIANGDSDESTENDNLKFIIKNISTMIEYLNTMKEYVDEKIKDYDNINEESSLVLIDIKNIINKMNSALSEKKFTEMINKENKKDDIILALMNILDVQMTMLNKINKEHLSK